MERVCFQLQVEPDLLRPYIEWHRAVWPRMLRAIERSGRRNYSIFVRDDGLLIGYYETDDDAVSAARLANDPDTAEWETASARFFANLRGERADRAALLLREVFHLEDQLADLERNMHRPGTAGRTER